MSGSALLVMLACPGLLVFGEHPAHFPAAATIGSNLAYLRDLLITQVQVFLHALHALFRITFTATPFGPFSQGHA
jgi:hypothetical protein